MLGLWSIMKINQNHLNFTAVYDKILPNNILTKWSGKMYAKVCKMVDKLEQKYINFWADLCNIESPTDDKRGVDEAGALIIGAAKGLDFDIVRGEEPISGDPFCIVMNGSADGTPIALSAHIDTVFPKGLFGSPAVKMDEDKIYGPGVMDCKGGVCAALYAMRISQRHQPCAYQPAFG